jgi:hypothetical protein
VADDVNIVVRVRNATRAGFDSVSYSLSRMVRQASEGEKSFGRWQASAISLAPALIPVAAAAVPIAASLASAGAAVGAFGAAVGGQVVALGEASDAETKYSDAVDEHGKASKEAVQAELAFTRAVAKLPPATRQAAAGLSSMKEQYKAWSDSLADDTMPVFTKAFATLSGLFPKLTPMVKGAAGELDRFVTIIAGGMESPGFDRFMAKFSDFATKGLQRVNDSMVRFMRTLDVGKVGGGLSEFMDYARANGPLVGETLGNIARAMIKVLVAASDVGVGLLQVVNAFAKLVAALPTGLVSTLLQVAVAFKAVKLAAAGFSVVSAGLLAVSANIVAMRSAAGGATGRVAGLAAALGALSTKAKIALAATGIGLLVTAVTQLSKSSRQTPPDVDRLTTSLGKLGQSGKVSGEAARLFGKDLDGLYESIRAVADPSAADKIEQGIGKALGKIDSSSAKEAAEQLDGIDKALANLVRGGKAELAAAALDGMAAAYSKTGKDADKFRARLDDYKAALADAAFEQELAAKAQGLFGEQALVTGRKLAEQKASADGLRGAIQALNDVQRQGLGGMIGFEAAIDAASKAAKENAGSLNMVGGKLDLNSEKSRTAATALQDLASKTDEAAGAARESGESWETVNGIYDRGRKKLIESAMQMGLTRTEAKKLADQILKTPDKTARLKGDVEDLRRKVNIAKDRLRSVPQSKRSRLLLNIRDVESSVRRAKRSIASVKSKSVTIHANYVSTSSGSAFNVAKNRRATGGVVGGHAQGGGPRSALTLVGEQGPELVQLPFGSMVRSNADTRRMMRSRPWWEGSSGGAALQQRRRQEIQPSSGEPMIVNLSLDGKSLVRLLVDPLRREIKNLSGGNVQAALGR